MAPKRIPALHKAAEKYADVRDQRMALTEEEVVLRDKVVELMHKHEKELRSDPEAPLRYKFDDVEISIEAKEKVKVKIGAGDEASPATDVSEKE